MTEEKNTYEGKTTKEEVLLSINISSIRPTKENAWAGITRINASNKDKYYGNMPIHKQLFMKKNKLPW